LRRMRIVATRDGSVTSFILVNGSYVAMARAYDWVLCNCGYGWC
jgi:hypothetical protein